MWSLRFGRGTGWREGTDRREIFQVKWTELDVPVDLKFHRERRVKDPSEVSTPMSKDICSNFGRRTRWDSALRLHTRNLRLPEGMF